MKLILELDLERLQRYAPNESAEEAVARAVASSRTGGSYGQIWTSNVANVGTWRKEKELMEFTVGQLIAYLRDNYDPSQPVVLEETSSTAENAVALPDVFQGMREDA